ncbi:COG1361 family protein [Crateriforma conspicua]|uniref:DUF11 domain-containing protein n=1 Tax=Crateriforma conspicua TaxID=2527996 RepID=UPI00118D4435|nr:DUF11 domain-containing protein [Crateriforma conspicua]QDV62926.1 Large cysteine-rich periplasmic protein omcB precursor [Crateriforma conspicua]
MTSMGRSLAMFATVVATATAIQAQNNESSMRTGDGLIAVHTSWPEEVRVGDSFSYTVDVENVSDNVTLHAIKLAQKNMQGVSIDSVAMQGDKADQPSGDQASGNQSSQDKSKKQNNQRSNKNNTLSIATLKPGETKTFDIQATADKQGELRSCLEIVDYKPAMCVTARAVKPQLELTKVAPKTANRCNTIELEYALKNGGTGDVGPITITDSLGKGLATIDGESELKFDIDGLKAGDTRRFVARVYASKTGEFSSRATAKADDTDLKSRSQKTTTKVVAADLAANVDGPNRLYGDELAQFTATITNRGDATAEDVRVKVMWPQDANLVDLSDPQMNRAKKQNNNGNESKSNQNGSSDTGSNNNESSNNRDQNAQMADRTLTIDRLEPGQSATFDYAIRPGELDSVMTKVVATNVCTVDAAEDQDNATSRASSTATANTKIVRLAALQLTVVDDEDPVKKGDEVVYTIRVWNEGDAPDQNVKLSARLPEQLSFVQADGPTEVKSEGNHVVFQPIETLKPGDEVTYTVTAKGDGNGPTQMQAELVSNELDGRIRAEEPTRIFQR